MSFLVSGIFFVRSEKMFITKEKFESEFAVFSSELDPFIFAFRLFSYLRMNRKFLQNKDCKRLYEETFEYLKIELVARMNEDGIQIKEHKEEFVIVFAEIFLSQYGEEAKLEEIGLIEYLEFRKGIWSGMLS